MVYAALFDTNGAYNCGGPRVDCSGNLEIDFGATGWFPNATEVNMCSLHRIQHEYQCVKAVAGYQLSTQTLWNPRQYCEDGL